MSDDICRICLNMNVRMFVLKNTVLQNLYELLMGGYDGYMNQDGKPVMACYMCYARLKRCSGLQQQAIKSNEILQELVRGGMVVEAIQSQYDTLKIGHTFQITPVHHLHLDPVQDVKVEIDSKTEDVSFPYSHKEDDENADVEAERQESPVNSEFIQSYQNSQSDSDDDLPLIAIGTGTKKKKAEITVKKLRKDKSKVDFKVDAKEIELTEEEQRLELLSRASSENYLNSPYKCEKCYKGFVHPQAFSNHMEKHDQSSGPHECGVCLLRYCGARQLRAHVASAHARRYACARCPHRSHTRHQARDHEKWHNGHTYPCQVCGQKFQKPTSYLTHMRKNHSEHVCERCGDSFVGRHGLLMHLSKTHKRDEPQDNPEEGAMERYCGDCNIQFLTVNAWKKHVLTSFKHTDKYGSSSRCDICGEEVSSLSRSAHVREHMRELRPQQSATPTATPAATPTLRCGQCEALFVTRSRLQAHVKRVHLGLKYNKNVVCEMCGKKCTSAAALRCHQRRHTGERPYGCAQCPARFAERGRLRVHARTHSGERPYACIACNPAGALRRKAVCVLAVHQVLQPVKLAEAARAHRPSEAASRPEARQGRPPVFVPPRSPWILHWIMLTCTVYTRI